MPKISIILPALNAAATVAETIESLRAQTYRDFELVFIDDGSTDNTSEIVQRYSQDISIRLIRHASPLGVAASLNDGILQSDSELIARIDSDDVALPNRLEKQVAFLESYFDVDICGSAMQVFSSNEQGEPVDKYVLAHPNTNAKIRTALLQRCAIAHPSVVCRRSIFSQIGLYDTAMDFAEDYDLWCRASMHGLTFANLQDVLMRYRVHAGQVSNQKAAMQYARDLAIRTKYLEHFIPGQVIDALPRLLSLSTAFQNVQELKLAAYQCMQPLAHLSKQAPDAHEFAHVLQLCASRHWLPQPASAKATATPPPMESLPTKGPTVLLNFLKGGIGNQLFQQAFALSLSRRMGYALFTDLSFYSQDPYANQAAMQRLFPHTRHSEVARLSGTGHYTLGQQSVHSLDAVAAFPIDARTVVLNGYWQSESYFDEAAVQDIRTHLESYGKKNCNTSLAQTILAAANPVAVHLRRRDYAHMGLCKSAYYLTCIATILEAHPDSPVYVFSDEPNYARHLFSAAGYQFTYVNGTDDLADLYLMALCRHFVISNSSYSWWGARLGEQHGGMIYYPKEWTTIDSSPNPCPARWLGVTGAVTPFSLTSE